jgi:hypothetical protein
MACPPPVRIHGHDDVLWREVVLRARGYIDHDPDEPAEEDVAEHPPVPAPVRLDLRLAVGSWTVPPDLIATIR